MRTLVVLFIATLLSTAMYANNENPSTKKVKEEIRTKIVKLLGHADFSFENEIKATVDLLVNKKGEIVILDVDSNNNSVESFIKRKLNYKKVYQQLANTVKVYQLPIKIIKE